MKKNTIISSYIIMFLFLFVSADSLIIGTNRANWAQTLVKQYPFIFFFFLTFYKLLYNKKFFRPQIYMLVIPIIYLLNFIFGPGKNSLNNYLHLIIIVIDAIMLYNFDKSRILEVYEKIIFHLAIFSLVTLLISSIVPGFVKLLPVIYNINGSKYYSFGFSNIWDYGLEFKFWLRNNGIFREPGIYQIYLNIGLFYYLFTNSKLNIYRIIIYTLTILSTTSTTGIISLILLLLAYMTSKNKNKIVAKYIALFYVLIFGIIVMGFSDKLSYAFTKMQESNNPSTASRIGSIYANIYMWIKYPILGIGVSENERIFPNLLAEYTRVIVADNTNTFLFILSSFGIIEFMIIMYGIYRMCKYFGGTWITSFILFIYIILLFSGQNLVYSLLPYLIFIFGISKYNYRKLIVE